MRRLVSLSAVFAVAAAPAAAQTIPSQQPLPTESKTVTKIVCKRSDVEETTGSRLGSAPTVCKKVQVPAEGAGKKRNEGHAPSHSGHAH
jgi:hypothetical protein